jgi:site-specific recombinase XerD
MHGVEPPKLKQTPPPALSEASIDRLFATCKGKDFRARRDLAILTLLLDTGLRRMELANLTTPDIDWERQTLRVLGKGDKARDVAFGNQSALALRAYQRMRKSHPHAESEYLWLGLQGPMLADAILRIIKRRAKEAGLERTWTHLFRHSFAHYFLEAGGREGDLKKLGGWESDSMVRWYGSGEAANRAQKAHRQYSPADRLLGEKKRGRK